MSTQHGGVVNLKPISEVAKFLKSLIPVNIPETYAIKPMFEKNAKAEDIRDGVKAFRDFLFLLCDNLILHGPLYAKPPKNPKSIDDYPFLHYLTNLLVDIGYYGIPAKSGGSLLITEMPLFAASTDEKGKKRGPKIPATSQIECLRFLTLCGFVFTSINLEAKKLEISKTIMLEISYPDNSIMLTGLKAMSIADMELRDTRRYWNDNNLLRCDYRLIKAEETDMLDVLKDILHPLPEKIQSFALTLHQHHMNMGLTSAISIRGDVHIAYSYIKKSPRVLSSQDIYSKRIWGFSISLKDGYCIVVRAKKTAKYTDVIEKFPSHLREKIARGYGCDRKLNNERCQGGCQGIRIPLDDSFLDISRDIEIWLDKEIERA